MLIRVNAVSSACPREFACSNYRKQVIHIHLALLYIGMTIQADHPGGPPVSPLNPGSSFSNICSLQVVSPPAGVGSVPFAPFLVHVV